MKDQTDHSTTLKGKRVLLLGGTSGIGLAVAEAAKTEGSDVVVVSSQQRRVEAALTLLGEGAEGHVADLSDETAVEALFGKLEPYDHLIYTAGDSVWQRALRETQLASLPNGLASGPGVNPGMVGEMPYLQRK